MFEKLKDFWNSLKKPAKIGIIIMVIIICMWIWGQIF
jgi:hypothetical protein